MHRPAALVAGSGVACCSFTVAAADPLVEHVMTTDRAVAVADVGADLGAGACRDTMVSLGTSAVVARRFELGTAWPV